MDEVAGDFEWDADKRQRNLLVHRIDFADVIRFDLGTAYTVQDSRRDYGERRLVSLGELDGRLHVLCWTLRNDRVRVISLRKANEREQKTYADRA